MEADALQEGRAIFSIDLHPAYASNALEGVRLQMESRLLRCVGHARTTKLTTAVNYRHEQIIRDTMYNGSRL